MDFDKASVFSFYDADEVKVGSKGYFANTYDALIEKVKEEHCTETLVKILNECFESRFKAENGKEYTFFYLADKPGEETYRPYENTDEMVEDFKKRAGAYGANFFNCPMFSPTIWIKSKESDAECLVHCFIGDEIAVGSNTRESLENVFEYYTYLDGTPCGKRI